MWSRELAKWDATRVSEALDALTSTEEFFPSISKLLDAVQAAMRRRLLEQRTETQQHELEMPRYDADKAKGNITAVREMLKGIAKPTAGLAADLERDRVQRGSAPPPAPCPESDHKHCAEGPIRVRN